MIRQILLSACVCFLVEAAGCSGTRLVATSVPAPVRWEDDRIAIDDRVQPDLLAVVTVTNRSNTVQTVPAFISSEGSVFNNFELADAKGVLLVLDAVHADWRPADVPVVELDPGRSDSEATDLQRAFPSLAGATPSREKRWSGMTKYRSTVSLAQ